MLLLNFSHPLPLEQYPQIEQLAGQKITSVRNITVHFDNEQPFVPQAGEVVDSVGLSPQEWQTLPILINLPSYNFGAVTILVELHGRMGYFPTILRIRPVSNGTLTNYEVAEVINLQAMRDNARADRR
ncbi:MAG: hypothetical protein ISS57_09315 [Anaerolineales bacterium]|nr:hypothetical protein [Anaerolineales bacterium]